MKIFNKTPTIKISKTIKTTLIISMVVILLGFLGLYIYTSYTQEFKIFPANVGSQSFSVAWSSEKQRRGCVIAIPQKNIKNIKILCQKEDKSNIHLLNFKNAIPDTIYKVFYINGLHIVIPNISSVITAPISEEQPPLPNPAYGSVINIYGAKAKNALVLLTAQTSSFQYPLVTTTNNSGNYTLDLNGFKELSDNFRLEATFDGFIWNDKFVSADIVAPIPQITVTDYVK